MRRTTLPIATERVVNAMSRMTLASSDDSPLLQTVKVKAFHNEVMDGIEHLLPYGFTMRPKAPDASGAPEIFGHMMGSNRTHGIAPPASDRRYRPNNLKEGEVVLHDDQGLQIYFSRDRIVINAPAGKEIHLQIGDNTHVLLTSDKAKMQQGTASVTCKGGNTYLGAESASHAVSTVDGPSNNVFATISETDSTMQASPVAKRTKKG